MDTTEQENAKTIITMQKKIDGLKQDLAAEVKSREEAYKYFTKNQMLY